MRTLAKRVVIGLALCRAAVCSAEMPAWDEVEGRLYVIRRHWWGRTSPQHDGIWLFDRQSTTYQRLRPFHFNSQPGNQVPRERDGFGSFFAGADGMLVFQAWPYYMEFELASLRLVRRYPPLEDPASVGWVIQGPVLTRPVADALGLEPGVYGFGTCHRQQLTRGSESPGIRCDPYDFPGWSPDVWFYPDGDPAVLLRRSTGPEGGDVDMAARVAQHFWWAQFVSSAPMPPVLSLDPSRSGFWRGSPRGVDFLPIVDGHMGPESLSVEFDFPPFDQHDEEELVLDSLFYHPLQDRFYGVTIGDGCEDVRWFFTLDGALGSPEVLDVCDRPDHNTLSSGLPLTFAWSGPRPQVHEQLVPVITRAEGRAGTFWTSELWLYNPSGEATTVELSRVAGEGARSVELPAHGSVRVPDVLGWLGGGSDGDGIVNDAMTVTSPYRWGEQVVAVSRVSTASADGDGGSFGQAVPAVPGLLGYSNHLHYHENHVDVYYQISEWASRVAHLSLDLREPDRFRHNLGVVNVTDEDLRMTLVWTWQDPVERDVQRIRPADAVQSFVAPAREVTIVNLEGLFPEAIREHWAPRIAVFGERPAAVWLSMVDNVTGDATFVPYTSFHWMNDTFEDRAAVPVVAHLEGVNDTFWRTDLYGTQGNSWWPLSPGPYDQPSGLFHPRQTAEDCGGAAATGEITAELDGEVGIPLDAWMQTLGESSEVLAKKGWRTVYPDVVHLFDACAEDEDLRGALEISTGSWTSGFSRTYTTREDGGTYGSMLPLYPIGGWPVQHFAGIELSEQLRVNVGLFNGDHEHPIVHRLTLFAADGALAAETTLTLEPLASLQLPLHHLFALGEGDLADGTYGLTVLPLDDDEADVEGRSWAYVSVVDNVTGDPTNWW